MMTLVLIRHLQIGERQFYPGDEVPPGLLSQEEIDRLLDGKQLDDSTERRSIYRLLHRFSGCSETERPTTNELTALSLQ